MKNRVILLSFLFLFYACTKFGKNVTVKGRVVNPITGQGIEGVEIWLQRGTAGLPGGTKTVKKATTDAYGNYELNKLGYSHYQAICVIGNRYALGWTQDLGESYVNPYLAVKLGKTMHVDFHAVEYGLLNFDIQNVNCEGPNDKMQFRKKYQFSEEYEGYSTERYGCYSYVSSSAGQLPSGSYIYETKVTRASGTTFIYDTILVDNSGNSTIYIHY